MVTYQRIKKLNPQMRIKEITDPAFKKYGQILEGYDFSEAMDFVNGIPLPVRGHDSYIQKSVEINSMAVAKRIKNEIYGGVNIDIGYAIGVFDTFCNLMEYHRCDEIMVATEDPLVIFVGDQRDIVDNQYDLSLIEAFFVPPGIAVDLYATTLHGYPCQTSDKGYRMLIFLVENTNNPIDFDVDRSLRETKLLANVNAFILIKPDSELCDHYPSAYPGLNGEVATYHYK